MPVLLVPASYVEGKTRSIAAAEAEHGSTQDTLVETTMGEVRLGPISHPTPSPPVPLACGDLDARGEDGSILRSSETHN